MENKTDVFEWAKFKEQVHQELITKRIEDAAFDKKAMIDALLALSAFIKNAKNDEQYTVTLFKPHFRDAELEELFGMIYGLFEDFFKQDKKE